MAALNIDIRRQPWYVAAIQRKYCSCHMRFYGWCAYELANGTEVPREELAHLICLACREQPKRYVPNDELRED